MGQPGTASTRKETDFPVFDMTGMMKKPMMIRKVEAGDEFFILWKLHVMSLRVIVG